MVNNCGKEQSYVYRKYASLCIELKQLYVAITRPKKRLIIYDDDAQARQPIQRLWDVLKIANVVTGQMIEQNTMTDEVRSLFEAEAGALGGEESSN